MNNHYKWILILLFVGDCAPTNASDKIEKIYNEAIDKICFDKGMIPSRIGYSGSGGNGFSLAACKDKDDFIHIIAPKRIREEYEKAFVPNLENTKNIIPKELCGNYKGPYGYDGLCK